MSENTKEIEREKLPWDEITDAERIERMRVIIKTGQKEHYKLHRELDELRQEVRRHRHGEDNEILLPANMINRGLLGDSCGCERSNAKPWF